MESQKGRQRGDIQRGDIQQRRGFGEYSDWGYGELPTRKDVYAKYLLGDEDDIRFISGKFVEWLHRMELRIWEYIQITT